MSINGAQWAAIQKLLKLDNGYEFRARGENYKIITPDDPYLYSQAKAVTSQPPLEDLNISVEKKTAEEMETSTITWPWHKFDTLSMFVNFAKRNPLNSVRIMVRGDSEIKDLVGNINKVTPSNFTAEYEPYEEKSVDPKEVK